MIIYIAGAMRDRKNPNRKPIMENIMAGIDAGIQVYLKGHIPVIPQFHYFMNLRDKEKWGEKLHWADYMNIDYHSLRDCDAMLKISSSHGADLEEKWMKAHHRPVYYDLKDVPDAVPFVYTEEDIEELFST